MICSSTFLDTDEHGETLQIVADMQMPCPSVFVRVQKNEQDRRAAILKTLPFGTSASQSRT